MKHSRRHIEEEIITCQGLPKSSKASLRQLSALSQVAISPRYFSGLYSNIQHMQKTNNKTILKRCYL